jgi:hypothetical protein
MWKKHFSPNLLFVSPFFLTARQWHKRINLILLPGSIAMQRQVKFLLYRFIALSVLFMGIYGEVFSQTDTLPTRTSCKQWDDTYLDLFNSFFWLILFGSCALSFIIPPLLGRFVWWATSPRWRIAWITLGVFLFGVIIVIGLPQALGFGGTLYSGVGEQYPDCAKVTQFGAEGLFYGAVGSNAAVALWPQMLLLYLVAALIGAAMAFGLSELLVQRRGLYAHVKGVG